MCIRDRVYTVSKETPVDLIDGYAPVSPSVIYDINGNQIDTIMVQNRAPIGIGEIPQHVQNAFLAIKDRKFRTHHGFDFVRTARAAFLTITGRRREGGSTLTQQLAKNAFLSPEQTMSRKIKEAILTKQTVKFNYFNTKGEHYERTADPLNLWFKEKAWYLFAYCHKKNDIRQFKITRIKNLTLTNEYFEKTIKDFEINNKKSTVETIKIIVEIDKSQAYRVYDEFSEESINKMENGDFEIIMEYPENEWIYGYLLSFGEHLKVKEPERIKKILSEKIVKMKKNYV